MVLEVAEDKWRCERCGNLYPTEWEAQDCETYDAEEEE